MIYLNSTKENISKQLKDIKNDFNAELTMQKDKLNILLEVLKQLNSIIQTPNYNDDSNMALDLLKKIKSNIENLKTNVSNIERLIELLEQLHSNYITDPENKEIHANIDYMDQIVSGFKIDLRKSDKEFDSIILKYVKESTFNIDLNTTNTKTNSENNSTTTIGNSMFNDSMYDSEIGDNNVLIISEKRRKVFLPYKVEDLNKWLRKNRSFHTIEDVINAKYIIPLEKYRNPAISRFREAYILMKKREKASITDSLDLALGLTFNSSLNPAIITACRNLEELDAYLDCLELNQLSKFEYFKIKYEILPTKR